MPRLMLALLLLLLCDTTAFAVEGATSIAPDGKLEFSGIGSTTFDTRPSFASVTFAAANAPHVTIKDGLPLESQFAPWFVQYAVAVDELLRAVALPAEPLADLEPGARLRSEAARLDSINRAAAKVRTLHAKVRIAE
jgi:hypothetical protein